MPDPSAVPIIILAFNRPAYLESVLTSLVEQQGVELSGRKIFLLQDGGRNRFSGKVHASDAVMLENLDLFRRIVPSGIPLLSAHNLGVAMNFDRAERLAFEELQADAAIFLEDDLLLGPYYLKVLDQLLTLALDDERIGYVAAYGDHKATLADQRARPSALELMGHNWAFGLTRRQWLRQRPYVLQYLEIVGQHDYRGRDHDRIIDLFHSWGLGVPGTSQDIAKSHACVLTGAAKVRTYAAFGRYIGEQGLHFNAEQFARMGFGGAQMLEEDAFRLVPPSDAQLREFVAVARRSAMVELVARRAPPASAPTIAAPAIPSPPPLVAPAPTPPPPAAPPPAAPLATPLATPMATPLATPPEALAKVRELISQGRLTEADALGQDWLARAPEFRDQFRHPAFLKELVRISLAQNRLDAARGYAAQITLQIPPGDPCVQVLFARAFHAAGQADLAAGEWRAVLRKDPAHAEAQRALQRAGLA